MLHTNLVGLLNLSTWNYELFAENKKMWYKETVNSLYTKYMGFPEHQILCVSTINIATLSSGIRKTCVH